MLAIIFALKHFRCYLTGLPHFRLVTDHKSLEFFDKSKEPVGQIARYLEFLSDFNFVLEHRPGRKHANADIRSRIRPCEVDQGKPCPSAIKG